MERRRSLRSLRDGQLELLPALRSLRVAHMGFVVRLRLKCASRLSRMYRYHPPRLRADRVRSRPDSTRGRRTYQATCERRAIASTVAPVAAPTGAARLFLSISACT